jgi:hypothetical protein
MRGDSVNWFPVDYEPDQLVFFVPDSGLGPMVEVYVGGGRRKITNAGWTAIERFYGHHWYDVVVVGGNYRHGRFELLHRDQLLANLVLADKIGKKLPPQGCPKCGHEGKFIRMALVCPAHGMFGGC